MSDGDVLEAIRVRAYHLWEQAGRPAGGDIEFWERARAEVEGRQPDPAAPQG